MARVEYSDGEKREYICEEGIYNMCLEKRFLSRMEVGDTGDLIWVT